MIKYGYIFKRIDDDLVQYMSVGKRDWAYDLTEDISEALIMKTNKVPYNEKLYTPIKIKITYELC